MASKPIEITDTTLRDAHQSLMATRMRTESMIPIAERLDQVGFWSFEVWGGATFDVSIRYLGEDPWERIRLLKRHIKRTPLQMLLRGQNVVGYRNYPDDVVIKFVEKAAENGIDIFRVFDALNDVRNMEVAIRTIKDVEAHAQGSISYTISPVHTIEYYVSVAKELLELDCDTICIKDMAGMLSPQVAYELVSALKEEIDLPLHLHCHSTSGMAMMTYFRACEAGVDIIDTAFSPFAWGTSQPPVESMVAALKDTAYDPEFDAALLNEIAEYFWELREKHYDKLDMIKSKSERVDPSIVIHQIPGGMFSNLLEQLREQNALNSLKEVLEEVPKVREELGYPPLVTPTSQLVGIQAVMNVLSGERYGMVSNEVRNYVKGYYGRPPAAIDEELKRKIIGDEKPITCRPGDLLEPVLDKIPEEVRPYIDSEEDELTYVLFPDVALEFFKGRKNKVGKEKARLPSEKIDELKDIATVSVAVATYMKNSQGVKAMIPTRIRKGISPWVLSSRRRLSERGT